MRGSAAPSYAMQPWGQGRGVLISSTGLGQRVWGTPNPNATLPSDTEHCLVFSPRNRTRGRAMLRGHPPTQPCRSSHLRRQYFCLSHTPIHPVSSPRGLPCSGGSEADSGLRRYRAHTQPTPTGPPHKRPPPLPPARGTVSPTGATVPGPQLCRDTKNNSHILSGKE